MLWIAATVMSMLGAPGEPCLARDVHGGFAPPAQELGPEYRGRMVKVSKALFRRDYANAIDAAWELMEACPGRSDGYWLMGFIHRQMEDREAAIEWYRLAWLCAERDETSMSMLVAALEVAGRWAEAMEAGCEILAINPCALGVLEDMGRIAARQGDLQVARACVTAIRACPKFWSERPASDLEHFITFGKRPGGCFPSL